MVTFGNTNNTTSNARRRRPGATNTTNVDPNTGKATTPPTPHTTDGYGQGMGAATPPAPTPPTAPGFPTTPGDVATSANAYGTMGANFLANGAPSDFGMKDIYGRAINNSNSAMDRLNQYKAEIAKYAQGGIDPINGANVQGILDTNKADRISDVNFLYDAGGQKMNDFQKAQAAQRNAAFQSGLMGSKEKAAAEANLSANLFRDRAGQMQQANELSRAETLGQLDQTRGANLANANLYSGLYGTDLSAANNFLNTAGNAAQGMAGNDLNFRNLGKNALDSALANQLESIKTQSGLDQQGFDNAMKQKEFTANVIGQILELIQQGKANKIDEALLNQLMSGMGISTGAPAQGAQA